MLYFDPLMLVVDVVAFIINRHRLTNCLAQMEHIDNKLLQENILINYQHLRRLSGILIVLVTSLEMFTTILSFFLFRDDGNELLSQTLWWLISLLPIYFSSLAKIWFIVLVYNVRQKFTAINGQLELQQQLIADAKGELDWRHAAGGDRFCWDEDRSDGGYLRNEIISMTGSRFEKSKRRHQTQATKATADKWKIVQVLPAFVGIC